MEHHATTMTTGNLENFAGAKESQVAMPAAGKGAEPRISLPTATLLGGVLVSGLSSMGVFSLIVWIGSLPGDVFVTGLLGATAVVLVAIAGVFVMTPWKSRAIADWMTVWMGATVFRLFITPLAVYLLYSAAPVAMAMKPLALSVAATYFATLLAEALVLVSHVRRSFPLPVSGPSKNL